MVVGIRVTSENIQTGKVKHCNSSYFTMVAKDNDGKNIEVPKLTLSNLEEVRRYYSALKRINLRKERDKHEETFDHTSGEALERLKEYNIGLDLKDK